MSKTMRYIILGIGVVILALSAVYFMRTQSDYTRQRDAKLEALQMAQYTADRSSDGTNQQSQGNQSVSNDNDKQTPEVANSAKAVLVRAKAAADAVTEMQERYPSLMAKVGVSEFKQDEEAVNAIISLREEGLKPYFPDDSIFREVWFTENAKVGPVKWNAYVASQINSGYVPVVWLLTDESEHILVCVSAYYDEATNSFRYPTNHWTAYGSNAVAFTGNDGANEDNRDVEEFVQSVKDLIGLPGSSTTSEGGSD